MTKLKIDRKELRVKPFLVIRDSKTDAVKKVIFPHKVQFGLKGETDEFKTDVKDANESNIGSVSNSDITTALGFTPQEALGFVPIDVLLSNAPTGIINSNVTAGSIGLGLVENKSSATIRGEITTSNLTTAGGFLSSDFNSTFTTRLGAASDGDFPSGIQNSNVSLPNLVTVTKEAGLGASLGHAIEHDDVGGFADKNRLLRSKIKAVGGSNIIDETGIVVGNTTMIVPNTITTGGDLTVVTASITCGGNIQAQANTPNLNLIANAGTPLINLYGQGGSLDPNANIGEIRWYGTEDDGTGNSVKVCYIKAENTESSWAYNSAAGTELVFGITKDGTTTPVDIVHMTGTSGAGRVGISDSTPSYKLDVDGQINATGNVRSGGVALSSDERLKENITDMGSMIEKIMLLKPRAFDWKKDARCESMQNDNDRLGDFGFIAQEILPILPNMVSEGNDPNKILGVSYSKLVVVLTKALQELNQKVTVLENQVINLKKNSQE